MTPQGIRIGSFAGAAIIIDTTILLLAAYMLGRAVIDGGLAAAPDALIWIAALFATVLIHEFGHAGVAAALKIPSKHIVLTFFGGYVEFATPPKTRWQEILVSAAGPLANLATFALISVFLSGRTASFTPFYAFFDNLGFASVMLGAFNLLPGHPLDGGAILKALLSYVMKPARARLITAIVGLALAIVLGLFAVSQQFWWTLFIGILLALSCWSEFRHASAALRAPQDEPTTSNA